MLLGIDIGGTTVKLGVVDATNGSIVAESSFPTPQTGSHTVAMEIAGRVRKIRSA
jgi:predicted NBD/HSP70 family sugar kinase